MVLAPLVAPRRLPTGEPSGGFVVPVSLKVRVCAPTRFTDGVGDVRLTALVWNV